jgi:outer membrane biogenesis lipoprotein LolB
MNKFAQKLFPLAALAALLLSGCAATQDADTDVAQRLEQGLRGQGRLVSPSPTGDSYGPYYQ